MKKQLFTLIALLLLGTAEAQKNDTVPLTPSLANTNVLIPGIHRWLVYFKMGKDSSRSRYQLWTRKIDRIQYQGKDAIAVTQEWENNDTIFHKVYSVCDTKSFAPLYQETWNRGAVGTSFNFITKEAFVNGKPISATDADSNNVKRYKAFEKSLGEYVLNWHLDLEVFPLLPYKNNSIFAINFYDPGFSAPKPVYYTVSGSTIVTGYDGQPIDCWLLVHDDNTRMKSHEVFYISKKTKEVVKLEQEFGGRFRYKIKLPFSN
ncbi:MAG: hypothetical protein V4450_07975 [Bacteroidota bacterium]